MSNSLGKQKSLLSLYWQRPVAKGKEECMRWVLSLLNASAYMPASLDDATIEAMLAAAAVAALFSGAPRPDSRGGAAD